MLDLNKQQELAKSMPPQLLQAAAQGQHPMIAPYIAASALASAQRDQQAVQQGQAAAEAPQQTTIAGIMATRQQQAMQQQQNMQRMQQQMAQPVRAAGGGLMSATPRQPAGMAALIRQHLANPVKAADGGLMAIKRFSEGGTTPIGARQTSGQRQFERLKRWLEQASIEQRDLRLAQLKGSIPVEMFRALTSIKGGPKLTYLPDENAPSIYADREEWADYRESEQGRKDLTGAANRTLLNRAEASMEPIAPEAPATDTGAVNRTLLNRAEAAMVPPRKTPNNGRGTINPPMALDPNQPTYPTAAPTTAAPAQPGIAGLTTDNVDSWGADVRNDYKQIGTNAPNVEAYREHEARRQAAQRALFEAESGGSSGRLDRLFARLAPVMTSRDGTGAARGLMALQQNRLAERTRTPEFDLKMTEQDIKEAQRLMELERGYKDKSVTARAGVSGPMAQEEVRQQGQATRASQTGAVGSTADERMINRVAELEGEGRSAEARKLMDTYLLFKRRASGKTPEELRVEAMRTAATMLGPMATAEERMAEAENLMRWYQSQGAPSGQPASGLTYTPGATMPNPADLAAQLRKQLGTTK